MLLPDPRERGEKVVVLPFAARELSRARADAAEVESQRCDVRVLESPRCAEDHFVVQRSTAGRQRMADDRHGGGILQIAVQRLQPSGGAVEINVSQWLRGHNTSGSGRGGASFT